MATPLKSSEKFWPPYQSFVPLLANKWTVPKEKYYFFQLKDWLKHATAVTDILRKRTYEQATKTVCKGVVSCTRDFNKLIVVLLLSYI